MVTKVLDNYPGNNSATEQAWDFIQRNVSQRHCSGIRVVLLAAVHMDWSDDVAHCCSSVCRWSAAAGAARRTGAVT